MGNVFNNWWCRFVAATAAFMLLLGFSSFAVAIPVYGNGTLGDFKGTLIFSASGMLTLSLTNTSPTANGGFITALLLNNPGGSITDIVSTSFTDTDFGLLDLKDKGWNGAPNGQFDFGASTGKSYTGGGKPQGGIEVGETETFTFNLTGSRLNVLSAQSFIDELSTGTGDGEGSEWLVVRFRGFEDGDSDKVAGIVRSGDPKSEALTTSVPGPGATTLLLLGLVLLGMGTLLRYRRS